MDARAAVLGGPDCPACPRVLRGRRGRRPWKAQGQAGSGTMGARAAVLGGAGSG